MSRVAERYAASESRCGLRALGSVSGLHTGFALFTLKEGFVFVVVRSIRTLSSDAEHLLRPLKAWHAAVVYIGTVVFTSTIGSVLVANWIIRCFSGVVQALFSSPHRVLTPHQQKRAGVDGRSSHLVAWHGSCISPLSKCTAFLERRFFASLLSIHAARFKFLACRLKRSALLVLGKRRRLRCWSTQRMKLARLTS